MAEEDSDLVQSKQHHALIRLGASELGVNNGSLGVWGPVRGPQTFTCKSNIQPLL